MTTPHLNRCAWCNRRVLATVDRDGDPACPPGLGCARTTCIAFAELARPLAISQEALRMRVLRCGSLEAALAQGARSSRRGRRPDRPEGTVSAIAERLGLTKQALYKAARKADRSLDEEIARRSPHQPREVPS